jgi:hypothetical protein
MVAVSPFTTSVDVPNVGIVVTVLTPTTWEVEVCPGSVGTPDGWGLMKFQINVLASKSSA